MKCGGNNEKNKLQWRGSADTLPKMLATTLIVVLFLSLSCLVMPVFAAESGSCGEKLEWTYSAGTLTVTGSGDMTDFTEENMAPWYEFADEVLRVVLPDELTSVGNLAFYGCKNLKTAAIPDYVRRIGSMAFAGCEGLERISLGKRVGTIGSSAFYGCLSLDGVRLLDGLESIGDQAFYRCESLRIITIPANVSSLGSSVFAYCKSLVRATVNARLTVIPEWTFYGCERLTTVVLPETIGGAQNFAFKNCDSLTTVYFSGDEGTAEALREDIAEDIPDFDDHGYISQGIPSETAVSIGATNNSDGTVTQENVSVRQDQDKTLVTVVEVTHPEDQPESDHYTTDITITVEDAKNLEDVAEALQNTLKSVNNTYSQSATSDGTDITVYLKNGDFTNGALLENLAGRPATLTVVTPDGSRWKVDCSELNQSELPETFSYAYLLTEASEECKKKLKTDNCYQLNFTKSAELNAEVLVQLPDKNSYANAFLYQIEKNGDLTRLQAVAVDQKGVAHFYLASVDEHTDYIIGLNVPDEKADDVIIPDTLMTHYGNAVDRLQKIEFVTTGVNSSWGLSFGQVTWILVGVLAACIIAVGAFMTVMNKRKTKQMAAKLKKASVK